MKQSLKPSFKHTFLPSLSLLVAALGLLAGCSSTPSSTRQDPTYEEAASSRFVALNKEAVSRLVAGLGSSEEGIPAQIARNEAPVLVATIVNVNDLRRSAPLGRTLSEQYTSQLATLGYNVKEMKLRGDVFIREQTGELMLSREIKDVARNHHTSLVLVGTYSVAANFTYVSLKFVRTEDSRILRAYDYALPNDKDVTRLLQCNPATCK
jgi:TolB-like protein